MSKKKKASEDSLNDLHSMVAKSITQLIKEDPTNVKAIEVAMRFLKDNSVTADLEYNEELQEVKQVVDLSLLPFPKVN